MGVVCFSRNSCLLFFLIAAARLLPLDAFHVPGRSISSRESICQSRDTLRSAWNNQDPNFVFDRLYAKRYRVTSGEVPAAIRTSLLNDCVKYIGRPDPASTFKVGLEPCANNNNFKFKLLTGEFKTTMLHEASGRCLTRNVFLPNAFSSCTSAGACASLLENPNDCSRSNASAADYVSPARCGCGMEPVVRDGTWKYLLFFTRKEIRIECEDWNECLEDHGCPQFSTCNNIIGSYECICEPGYHVLGDVRTRVGTYQDVCELDAMIAESAGATFNTISVKVLSPVPSIAKFRVTLSLWLRTNELITPSRGATKVVDRTTAINGVLFNGLDSGTEYSFRFEALDSANQPIPQEEDAFVTVATTCSCDTGDGRPDKLIVTQVDGFIVFSFVDKSTCEEAFAFARRQVDPDANGTVIAAEDEVFTPSYYYFSSGGECKDVPFKPGKQASDDLRVSDLEVGRQYQYCVRAIAPLRGYSTEYTCETFRIRWEASVEGRVTLDPNAGSLPVADVDISYALYDLDNVVVREGVATTGESGEFSIPFNEDLPDFTKDGLFRLQVYFNKTTGNIPHQFKCQGGQLDCTTSGVSIYLKHLRFDQPLHVFDDTSVPFSGEVVVANTAFASLQGCPVVGAEVCLVDHASRRDVVDSVCVTTGSDGRYSIPAVIGLRVSAEVRYMNHTFSVIDPALEAQFQDGILISPSGIYKDNDFMDTTNAYLTTEVAGGRCNRQLGTSRVLVKISNCPDWPGVTLEQDGYKALNTVPAHLLEVSVDEVVGHTHATDVLRSIVQYIDLTSIEMEDGEVPDDALADAEDRKRLRFQYNGTMGVQVRISRERRPSCDPGQVDPEGVAGADTTSFHVLEMRQVLDVATILFAQKFGADIPDCEHIDNDLPVQVTNGLGLVEGSLLDQTYRQELETRLDNTNLALMEMCNKGCSNLTILHDTINNITSNARVVLGFRLSRPNPNGRLTKYLNIVVGGSAPLIHRAVVVVTGDFDDGELYSVGLPTYKPLLVLRDPPGGESYAFYENVRSKVRVELEEKRNYAGLAHNLQARVVPTNNELDLCSGGGFGAIVIMCQNILDQGSMNSIQWFGNTDFLTNIDHTQGGGEYSLVWSYETSRDVWTAGHLSDAFLVPNLNVVFRTVRVVDFDDATCQGSAVTETAFNIDSVKNQPAIAWYTRYTLENVELPELQRLSTEFETRRTEEQAKAQPDANVIEELTTRKQAVDDAFQGWTDALDAYKDTNAKIANGQLDAEVPHKWFDRWAGTVDKGAVEPDMPATWTGMVPESLAKRSQARSVPWTSTQRPDGNENELEQTHLIKFSGGGEHVRFEMKHGKSEEHVSQLGPPGHNVKTEHHIHDEVDFTVSSKAGFGIRYEHQFNIAMEHQHIRTDTTNENTRIGFVLGDEDSGDKFDVQVHFDPYYGTFAFNTVAGASRCPHEDNTVRREAPAIQVFPPAEAVLPDEEMVFQLLLTNEGDDLSSFQLAVDHRSNTGNLVHLINGDTLAVPQMYDRIDAKQTISSTLTLTRGPELFDYPPIKLQFRSACEFVRNIGDGNLIALGEDKVTKVTVDVANKNGRIVFTEPCPQISWAGDIERDQGFVINAGITSPGFKVQIQNEGTYRFERAVLETRLQKVELLFRRKNDVQWRVARARPVGGTDFAIANFAEPAVEDEFGFAALEWEFPIFDGEYEIMAQTTCEDSGKAELDTFTTPVISGSVDRKPPVLFGLPSPAFKDLYPSEEILFRFSEPIDCKEPYSFIFDITFSNLSLTYDTTDLLILCESQGGTIAVQFPATAPFEAMLGQTISISLHQVRDMQGNEIESPVVHRLDFVSYSPTDSLISFLLKLETPCDPATFNVNATEQAIIAELSAVLQVDSSRLAVEKIRCVRPGLILAHVSVLPVTPASSSRRVLQEGSSQSGIDVFQRLKTALQTSLVAYPLLNNSQLDPSSFQVKSVSASDDSAATAEPRTVFIPNPPQEAQMQGMQEMMSGLQASLNALEQSTSSSQDALVGALVAASVIALFSTITTIGLFVRYRSLNDSASTALLSAPREAGSGERFDKHSL